MTAITQERLRELKAPDWADAWLSSASNPWLFATAVLGYLPAGVPNPEGKDQLEAWQDKFLRDFFLDASGQPTDSPRHSVRAGHGVGKGTLLAILAIWFPLTHYDSKCVITANSQDQLRDNNWSELRKQARRLPLDLYDKIQIDEERMSVRASPEMAFVVRRTSSKSNPESLQGIHAKHVLYLIDEASGIPDIVFEIAQGSLSTKGAMACMFSNPTRASGYFFDTHNRLRHRWRTWVVNCEDVPRARGHIDEVIEAYGRGSNKYRVRVLGEFPTADDSTVIPLELVEAARRRDVAPRDVRPIWGVDVARFGDDSSALAKRQGNVLLEPVQEWHGKDTMQLVGLIMDAWMKTDDDKRPSEIVVDVIGIGSGVVDRLAELDLPVRGCNVAEAASIDDKYSRLRDEGWWRAREWFAARDCFIPNDEKLIAELTGPTYDFASNGKLVVESKKDMRKRGLASPNKADAFIMTLLTSELKRQPIRRHRPSYGASAWSA
jgi:phage terminase large subunit